MKFQGPVSFAGLGDWLKSMRSRVVDLEQKDESGAPLKLETAILDPRSINVFIGSGDTSNQGTPEAREALFADE